MGTEELVLSDDERMIILDRRKKIAKEKQDQETKLRNLKIAAEYEEYLQESGMGSTFSTFMNDFGFDEPGADQVFRSVERIRQAANLDRPND